VAGVYLIGRSATHTLVAEVLKILAAFPSVTNAKFRGFFPHQKPKRLKLEFVLSCRTCRLWFPSAI